MGAKLKSRRADADVPFAASFPDAEMLAGAVEGMMEARPPLWHVELLNPARATVEAYVLFGAYAREHETEVAGPLRGILESHRGRVLGAADAHRVWGERFFPLPLRTQPPSPRTGSSPAQKICRRSSNASRAKPPRARSPARERCSCSPSKTSWRKTGRTEGARSVEPASGTRHAEPRTVLIPLQYPNLAPAWKIDEPCLYGGKNHPTGEAQNSDTTSPRLRESYRNRLVPGSRAPVPRGP